MSESTERMIPVPEAKLKQWLDDMQKFFRPGSYAATQEIEELLANQLAGPIPVSYNHGGSAEWTAIEVRKGWWRIEEWGRTIMGDLDEKTFWSSFTKVEGADLVGGDPTAMDDHADAAKDTCPKCRHQAHADWCPNMASDNDCSCTYDSNEAA